MALGVERKRGAIAAVFAGMNRRACLSACQGSDIELWAFPYTLWSPAVMRRYNGPWKARKSSGTGQEPGLSFSKFSIVNQKPAGGDTEGDSALVLIQRTTLLIL